MTFPNTSHPDYFVALIIFFQNSRFSIDIEKWRYVTRVRSYKEKLDSQKGEKTSSERQPTQFIEHKKWVMQKKKAKLLISLVDFSVV